MSHRKIDDYMKDLEPLNTLQHLSDNNNTVVAEYAVGTVLGTGGFAKVYLATETSAEFQRRRTVALKIVPMSRIRRADQQDKIEREIKIQRAIYHPNIVTMLSHWSNEAMVVMVLEYCEVGSLSGFMRKFPQRKIPEGEAVKIGHNILQSIKYLHEKGIIHRDIKMGNIVLSNGVAKLADFGLAIRFGVDEQPSMCGTPNFLAPEVLRQKKHVYQSDVWAFGCVLFCMLAGEPAFRYTSLKETGSKIVKGEYVIPSHFSANASCCIRQILALNPSTRLTPEMILETLLFRHYEKKVAFDSRKRSNSDIKIPKTKQKQRRTLNERNENNATGRRQVAAVPHSTPLTSVRGIADLRRPFNRIVLDGDMEEPVYVTKWIDNSKHNGFGYTLSNGDVGVLQAFQKTTLFERNQVLSVIPERTQVSHAETKLFYQFKKHMERVLVHGGDASTATSGDLVHVVAVKRIDQYIVMSLSSGACQINILDGKYKGIKIVVAQSGFLLINRARQKKLSVWEVVANPRSKRHEELSRFLSMYDSGILAKVFQFALECLGEFRHMGQIAGIQQLSNLVHGT